MRAAIYRGPDCICMEEVPIPEPGPGEVLVRIAACGVCGTDIKKIRHGFQPPPRIYGHEMAGTIAALGHGVEGWQVGDRVAVTHHMPCRACYFCRRRSYAQCPTYRRTGTTAGFEPAGGGFAEYVRVLDWIVTGGGIVRLPDDVAFEEATFLEPVNTCLKAVRRACIGRGDTVLVCGQGAIGLLLMQLARREGAAVLASDPIAERRSRASELGAAAVLDPAGQDVTAMAQGLTCGRGVDAALVAVPGAQPIRQALEATRAGGRVLLFANTRAGETVPVDAGMVCAEEKDLIGSYSSSIELNDEVERIIFRREIDVRSLITDRFSLGATWEAICRAASPSPSSLKVLVIPQS